MIEATAKAKRIANQLRKAKIDELLSPLSRTGNAMGNLLESVATPKLQAAYNKYVDTVLNEATSTASKH